MKRLISTLKLVAGIALICGGLPAGTAMAQGKSTVIFAAASMRNALDAAMADYKKNTGKDVKISYAGSSTLAKQIEQGAPADIFISADTQWMDYVDGKGLIDKATRKDVFGNALVMVAPKDSTKSVAIGPDMKLADLLGSDKLAMADTNAVPAGLYGKQALTKLGQWESVQGKIAQAADVRAALALVSRGEAPLGIVYATDAKADPKVKMVATFPADTHPPIVYPAALVKNAGLDAKAALDFIESDAASHFFKEQGFTFLPAY
ncbi:molybdate transport system substrate-binding protein [Faunimonas pinastri]|uniref:Molybdate transport system substrate-binding protein n=1 Tax=Faunimonas pinastri TaxID=1855383 RepID=A0A1H9NS72_9HYPH|nr:molybdate transport system substrate-binding protein [Faunimonas pinastri]